MAAAFPAGTSCAAVGTLAGGASQMLCAITAQFDLTICHCELAAFLAFLGGVSSRVSNNQCGGDGWGIYFQSPGSACHLTVHPTIGTYNPTKLV